MPDAAGHPNHWGSRFLGADHGIRCRARHRFESSDDRRAVGFFELIVAWLTTRLAVP